MSLNAAALKLLAAKGLSADDIVELAEALESGVPKSTGAVRQARYRENKKTKAVTGDVTNDVTGDVTTPPIEEIIPPSSEANASGGEPPTDPIKEVFDLGVSLLVAGGKSDKEARSLIGKWRKAAKSDAKVLDGLLDCRARSISEPVEWLEKRFQVAKWVSASGYEYRGSDHDALREAERRGDMNTYWSIKAAMKSAPPKEAKPERRRGSAPIGQLAQSIAARAGA